MTRTIDLTVRGPFWEAEVTLLSSTDAFTSGNAMNLRDVFLDTVVRNEGQGNNARNVFRPGTMLALCFVRTATIKPLPTVAYAWKRAGNPPPFGVVPATEAALRAAIGSGEHALLLLDFDPDAWKQQRGNQPFPVAGCVAGEIALDLLAPQNDALTKLHKALGTQAPATPPADRQGPADLLGNVTLHASGVSLLAQAKLPWQTERVTAPLWLARRVPDPAAGRPAFRLAVETERLTPGERTALQQSWTGLARALDPSMHLREPDPPPRPGPMWAALEVAGPTRLPRMAWQIEAWLTDPTAPHPLRLERDELSVVLTDRRLNDPAAPPTSIARLVPDAVTVTSAGDGSVTVELARGAQPAPGRPRAEYLATRDAAVTWRERWSVADADLAFDPVATARDLREAQRLPEPEPEERADPAVLWGFVPLVDGWAQLPVPNLSEELYLRAGLANRPVTVPSRLEGAVSYGGDDGPAVRAAGEHPWRLSVLDVQAMRGAWRLVREGARLVLDRASLSLDAPDLRVEGLLWLSTERPTDEDALPALEDFAGGVRPLALRTVRGGELEPYPPVVTTRLRALQLDRGGTAAQPDLPDARLGAWSVEYGADAAMLRRLVDKQVLPATTFDLKPLVWRRHPSLPMVQALPLTQSKVPPNRPSASRQLAPFELPTAAAAGTGTAVQVPSGWRFGVASGAGNGQWPALEGTAPPAAVWSAGRDLPLAALSLPGVVLDPGAPAGLTDPATGLAIRLRHDLPYADEVHALAQLPKLPVGVARAPERPDPPAGAPPLTRERMAAHWRRLAERAALAAADAVDALGRQGSATVVQWLAEPLAWPVAAEAQLATYPGAVTLRNAAAVDDQTPAVLSGDAALDGISGGFAEAGGALKRLPAAKDAPYRLEGGSMAARREADGALRDQRGLRRSPTTGGARLLRTKVALAGAADGDVELTSALQAVDLAVPSAAGGGATDAWHLWFRDLPVRAGAFDRAKVVSDRAQDVNDPEALARERGHLTGYEWRLAPDVAPAAPGGAAPLRLFGLEFHPLTLARVEVAADAVTLVEVVGRLQLPLPGTGETTDVANAVTLRFAAAGAGPRLALASVAATGGGGEWPLARAGAELGDAPRLRWTSVALQTPATGPELVVEAQLAFLAFGAEWLVPFPGVRLGAVPAKVPLVAYRQPTTARVAVEPASVAVTLDLTATRRHTAELGVEVRLGRDVLPARADDKALTWTATKPTTAPAGARLAFSADVRLVLLDPALAPDAPRVSVTAATVLGRLPLAPADVTVEHAPGALQLAWQSTTAGDAAALQALPGMHLAPAAALPGFAALAFTTLPATAADTSRARLRLDTAFTETALPARWGRSLLDRAAPPTADDVLSSSAGDLTVGCTGRWTGTAWEDTLLLNGFTEVRSIVSWPTTTKYEADGTLVTFPAARPAQGGPVPLAHTRHTMRVLFNQHELAGPLLVQGTAEGLLFDLARDRSWQTLAVVEHQLLDVTPSAALTGPVTVANDRRWTAVQEVRLVPPAHLRALLRRVGSTSVTGGIDEDPADTLLSGLFAARLRDILAPKEPAPGDLGRLPAETLLVEASALHWIRLQAATARPGDPPPAATTLQFLPGGNVTAGLSAPGDLAPTDADTPDWLLLHTPFLGRLQSRASDGLTPPAAGAPVPSPLQVDPLLLIHRARSATPAAAPPDAALGFAAWADTAPAVMDVSGFDTAAGRRFGRLDPASLEVSWARFQHPGAEPASDRLQSVLAALPATPARLSRATALRAAFDATASAFPPVAGEALPADPTGAEPVWREGSLLVSQGLIRPAQGSKGTPPPFAFPFLVLQVLTSDLGAAAPATGDLRRYPAATALPTRTPAGATAQKVSLTVSPYAALGFGPATGASQLELAAAELVCLDRVTGALQPIASRAWEPPRGSEDVPDPEAFVRAAAAEWARETHRRQAPESPIAVLRWREVRSVGSAVVVAYRFAVVTGIERPAALAARAFRLRSDVARLRFREGQFGGTAMPPALRRFELAPPQVTGVQPLRLAAPPAVVEPVPPLPSERRPAPRTWPFGLTALRLSVKYTDGGRPAIGRAASALPAVLWWQAPGHAVQFRGAASGQAVAGLPASFRAPAIRSLLPSVTAPLPRVEGVDGWQPVLPGTLRELLVGARPGTLLAIRQTLVRQTVVREGDPAPAPGDVVVSGTVPVQHRVPRPLPLAAAVGGLPMLPSAGPVEPARNALVTRAPADEAHYAACGADLACSLRLTLSAPARAAADASWDGELAFTARVADDAAVDAEWEVDVALVHEGRRFAYVAALSEGAVRRFVPVEDDAADVLALATAQRSSRAEVHVRVMPLGRDDATAHGRFRQTLTFPLLLAGEAEVAAPLEPVFVHFEDPEYNRLLASAPARKATTVEAVVGEGEQAVEVSRTFALAADRRQYDPRARMAVRWDWEGPPLAGAHARLRVRSVDENGVARTLAPEPADPLLADLPAQALVQLQLDRLVEHATGRPATLLPGQSVELSLTLTDPAGTELGAVFLTVDVVADPVTPVPEAAYGLLRTLATGRVECVRFAWSPDPTRVELVCPADLASDTVRRRAVFHLTDTHRTGATPTYAVQKIARDGATHVPTLTETPR